MNLGFDFRRGLQTLPNVLEQMVSRINSVWRRQHTDDGAHGAITASSIDVSGTALTGPLRVESRGQSLPTFPDGTARTCFEVYQAGTPGESILHAKRSMPIPTPTLDPTSSDLRVLAKITRFPRNAGMVTINDPQGAITCTPDLISFAAGVFNGVIQANGGQIQFPAVQLPSANPNTLDDYEEGAWTPAWTFAGGGAPTYSLQQGTYTKVGRFIALHFRTIFTNLGGAAGQATMQGVFPHAFVGFANGSIVFYANMAGLGGSITWFAGSPTQMVPVTGLAAGTAAITALNFTNTSDLIGFIVGETAT